MQAGLVVGSADFQLFVGVCQQLHGVDPGVVGLLDAVSHLVQNGDLVIFGYYSLLAAVSSDLPDLDQVLLSVRVPRTWSGLSRTWTGDGSS